MRVTPRDELGAIYGNRQPIWARADRARARAPRHRAACLRRAANGARHVSKRRSRAAIAPSGRAAPRSTRSVISFVLLDTQMRRSVGSAGGAQPPQMARPRRERRRGGGAGGTADWRYREVGRGAGGCSPVATIAGRCCPLPPPRRPPTAALTAHRRPILRALLRQLGRRFAP